jgi:hypothetical protein
MVTLTQYIAMHIKPYSSICFICLLLLLAVACKKNEFKAGATERPLTKYELLTFYKWRLSSFTRQEGNNTPLDLYNNLPTCIKDNFLSFNDNRVMLEEEGTTRCNPADPASRQLFWVLAGDSTILRYGPDANNTMDASILSLSFQSLRLQYADTINGITWKTVKGYDAFR